MSLFVQVREIDEDFPVLASLLGKKSKSLVGVDISSTSVKVLELSCSNDHYQVESYAVEPLPANAIVEQSIQDDEAVGEAIKKAVARSRSSAKKAAIAVAGSSVITKTVQMNGKLNDDEMDFQIRAEADQYIPYPLDEVALDWEIQGAAEQGGGMVDVLLAACRTETVERRKDAIEYAGLDVGVVDVEAFCTERAFQLLAPQIKNDEVETIAVFDVGATMTTLSVLYNGRSIYMREQMFGGKQLVEDTMRHYGLSEDEVIHSRQDNTLPDDYETEVLEPFRQSIVQQISRSLQFFYSSSQFNNIDGIILAGGTASIPDLQKQTERELGTLTLVANPFADMTISPGINAIQLKNDASSLIIACGLAMRGLD